MTQNIEIQVIYPRFPNERPPDNAELFHQGLQGLTDAGLKLPSYLQELLRSVIGDDGIVERRGFKKCDNSCNNWESKKTQGTKNVTNPYHGEIPKEKETNRQPETVQLHSKTWIKLEQETSVTNTLLTVSFIYV